MKHLQPLFLFIFALVPFALSAQEWLEFDVSSVENLNSLHFSDENHGWIVGEKGTILKYSSGGWISVDTGFSDYEFNSLFFTDSTQGWIIGEAGIIIKYSNGNFSIVESPTTENLNDIYMINGNKGWIVGDNRTILEFNSNIWTSYPMDGYSSNLRDLNDVQFLDPTFGVIVGDYNRVLNYENPLWHEWEDPTNMQDNLGLYILNKENIFWYNCDNYGGAGHTPAGTFYRYNSVTTETDYLGTFGFVFNMEIFIQTTSGGWAVGGNGLFKYDGNAFSAYHLEIEHGALNSLWFTNDSTGWIVGDQGKVFKYNPLGNTSNNSIKLPNFQCYPNPVDNLLNIVSPYPVSSIQIYNINGQKQKEYFFKNISSPISLDLDSFEGGLYILYCTTSKTVYSKKLFLY